MTDTEKNRIEAICKVANVKDIGELSDGFHTFNGLYEQRMILFAALVKAYKDKAWKSYRHEDGEYCFGGGWFIVGIDTPEGSYTYHYENKYWDIFDCIVLPRSKHWDGHTEADAETRLMSLQPEQQWIPCSEMEPKESGYYLCTHGGSGFVGLDYYTTQEQAEELFADPEDEYLDLEEYIGWTSKNVIAWMHRPDPWKGKQA